MGRSRISTPEAKRPQQSSTRSLSTKKKLLFTLFVAGIAERISRELSGSLLTPATQTSER